MAGISEKIRRASTSVELVGNIFSKNYLSVNALASLKQGKNLFSWVLLFCVCLIFPHASYSQEADTTKQVIDFRGSVSVTNNGFSFIPTSSLGKPATIIELSVGGKRMSFDPQFRFDLDGLKPWSLIFIWRYKLIQTERFQLKPGIHLPAIAFRTRTIEETNGLEHEEVFSQRFLTPELTASLV